MPIYLVPHPTHSGGTGSYRHPLQQVELALQNNGLAFVCCSIHSYPSISQQAAVLNAFDAAQVTLMAKRKWLRLQTDSPAPEGKRMCN